MATVGVEGLNSVVFRTPRGLVVLLLILIPIVPAVMMRSTFRRWIPAISVPTLCKVDR